MERKRIISLFFLLPFRSSGMNRRWREKWRVFFFLLFFLSFCFFPSVFQTFSFFFSFPFPALEGKWEWEGVGIFPLLFLNSFLFWEKNERINWKKSKEVLPLFLLNFLYFFFLLILLLFSFWEEEREWGEDKGNCPKGAKKILQEHLLFQQTPFTPLWTKSFIVLFNIKPHSFRPCSSPDEQGLFLFSDLVNMYFLPSLFPFSFVLQEEKWEEKRIIFLFFSSLNFLIQNDRILLFLLFFLSFCFFSLFFSILE